MITIRIPKASRTKESIQGIQKRSIRSMKKIALKVYMLTNECKGKDNKDGGGRSLLEK